MTHQTHIARDLSKHCLYDYMVRDARPNQTFFVNVEDYPSGRILYDYQYKKNAERHMRRNRCVYRINIKFKSAAAMRLAALDRALASMDSE